MQKRRRFKQTESLQDRLAAFAKDVREKASLLKPGAEKDALMRKARQADSTAHLGDGRIRPACSPRSKRPDVALLFRSAVCG